MDNNNKTDHDLIRELISEATNNASSVATPENMEAFETSTFLREIGFTQSLTTIGNELPERELMRNRFVKMFGKPVMHVDELKAIEKQFGLKHGKPSQYTGEIPQVNTQEIRDYFEKVKREKLNLGNNEKDRYHVRLEQMTIVAPASQMKETEHEVKARHDAFIALHSQAEANLAFTQSGVTNFLAANPKQLKAVGQAAAHVINTMLRNASDAGHKEKLDISIAFDSLNLGGAKLHIILEKGNTVVDAHTLEVRKPTLPEKKTIEDTPQRQELRQMRHDRARKESKKFEDPNTFLNEWAQAQGFPSYQSWRRRDPIVLLPIQRFDWKMQTNVKTGFAVIVTMWGAEALIMENGGGDLAN